MARTKCECPLAGYCNRHGVEKTPHEHMQCKHNPTYFNKWEKGQMPGQENAKVKLPKKEAAPEPAKEPKRQCPFCKNMGCTGECRNDNKLPSVWQMAKNAAVAAKDAAKDGFTQVSDEEVERRKEICNECPHFIPNQNRCEVCGCALALKNKLRSQNCPKGYW